MANAVAIRYRRSNNRYPLFDQPAEASQSRPAAADPLERRPLGRAQPPLDEQVPVREQLTHLLLDSLLRPAARLAAFELGRRRGNLGAPAARRLRSWATAERIAVFTSCRTWNW